MLDIPAGDVSWTHRLHSKLYNQKIHLGSDNSGPVSTGGEYGE